MAYLQKGYKPNVISTIVDSMTKHKLAHLAISQM